jgi:hypothetical protein
MRINNAPILTYRFNKKLMTEIETLKSEFLARNKVGKDTYRLYQLIMQKQYALERGKSISRGMAIAKMRKAQLGGV